MEDRSRGTESSGKRRLFFASQPQLLLVHEKDAEYVTHITAQVTDLLDTLGCGRWTNVFAPEIHSAATMLYYGMTVGRGHQTLGQEYVDCFMALEHRTPTSVRVSPMTVGARTVLVLVRTTMAYLTQRSDSIQQLLVNASQRISARLHGVLRRAGGDRLLGVFSFAASVHLLYFFANGRFYDYAMRIAKIRMLTNQQFRTQQEQLFFRNLVLVLGLRILLELVSFGRQAWALLGQNQAAASAHVDASAAGAEGDATGATDQAPAAEKADAIEQSSVKCPLCMGDVSHPSATPCGHIFCWACVMSWCQSNRQKSECAICRRTVRPQDIIPLYNYR